MLQQLKSFLENLGNWKKYFFNTSWLLTNRALQMILGIVVGALVARYLGPEQFGILNYVISYVTLFAAFSNLGLANIVVKKVVEPHETNNAILGSAFVLKLAGSVVAVVLISISALITEDDNFKRYALLLTSLPLIFRSTEIISFHFQAEVLSKFTAISNMVTLIIVAGLKLWFIYIEAPLLWFFYLFLVDAFIFTSMVLITYAYKGYNILHWRFRIETAKKLIKESWPLMFFAMVLNIFMNIDQLMIGKLLGDVQVGFYAPAYKLSSAWYAIPWIITSSVFPAIIKSRLKSIEIYNDRLMKLFGLVIYLAFAIAIPVQFLSPYIIDFIYGQEFIAASPILVIHIWSSLFVFIRLVSDKWLITENLQRFSLYNVLIGAAINIGLNLWMIPEFGIIGAAWATLISQFIAYYLILAFSKRTRPIFYMQTKAIWRCLTFRGLK